MKAKTNTRHFLVVLIWEAGLRVVVKAHRLVYHSTLGLRVIKKKNRVWVPSVVWDCKAAPRRFS